MVTIGRFVIPSITMALPAKFAPGEVRENHVQDSRSRQFHLVQQIGQVAGTWRSSDSTVG